MLTISHNSPREVSVRVYHNADQSIANLAYVYLAFNSERWDTHGQHDPATNNTRLTCQVAGKYIIAGSVCFAANSTELRYITIRLNGATTIAEQRRNALTNVAVTWRATITTIYDLAVGDYVELGCRQNSGGALDLLALGNYSPEFMMSKVRG